MQRILVFKREKDHIPRTMYTRLARFARESGGVFVASLLVKVFLSNIDKRLLDLALPKIIMEFGSRATLKEAFAIVDQCDHALCHHDAIDLVSLLVDFSKSRKSSVTTQDWRRQRYTKPCIIGFVRMRTMIRRIVLRSKGKSKP